MKYRYGMIWSLLALGVLLSFPAQAQAPTQPYFGVTSSTGAKGFQPVDVTHGLPVNVSAPYPAGSSPITASATGTSGAITATLTGAASVSTFICGFVVTSGGTTSATLGNVTVTGTVSGTLNFTYVFVSSGQGVLGVALPSCIPSSAVNTSIVVNVPAGGTGTTVAATAWGYTK